MLSNIKPNRKPEPIKTPQPPVTVHSLLLGVLRTNEPAVCRRRISALRRAAQRPFNRLHFAGTVGCRRSPALLANCASAASIWAFRSSSFWISSSWRESSRSNNSWGVGIEGLSRACRTLVGRAAFDGASRGRRQFPSATAASARYRLLVSPTQFAHPLGNLWRNHRFWRVAHTAHENPELRAKPAQFAGYAGRNAGVDDPSWPR